MDMRKKMDKRDVEVERKIWNQYWEEEMSGSPSLKKRISIFIRNRIFLPEIARYLDKYFKEGIFLEAGSGSGSASSKICKRGKVIIAMDLSKLALEECSKNPNIDKTIQGDIFNIPFDDCSLNGIWNSGVMEHFSKEDCLKLLLEFRRVLKDNGKIILFWPSTKLPASWLIDQIILLGVNLPRSIWNPGKKGLKEFVEIAKYKNVNIKTSWTLNHYIVIAEK